MRALSFFSRLSVILLIPSLLMVLHPSLVLPAQGADYPVFDDFPLPESINLCGEPMPLENRYVWEMLDREFTIAVWDRPQVFMWLKRAGRYFPYIEKKLAEAGMPEDLKYLAVVESALLIRVRSHKGAMGPWQFMSNTARQNDLRKDHIVDERLNFERSTEAAINYLKRLKSVFGTWTLALAAYNYGRAHLKKEIKEQGVKDFYRLKLPLETERFIFRIAAVKTIMENPERYGYSLSQERIYRPIKCDTVPVRIRMPFRIRDVAHALGTDFKVLKALNPHILGRYLPTGRYTIKVPLGLGPRMATVLKQVTPVSSQSMKEAYDDYYIVQPGDTLSHIAMRTRIPVATLKTLNGIEGFLIRVGQKIRLSP